MGQTLSEKIIARAAGQNTLSPGDIVTCRVDLAMVHDSSGPRRLAPMLKELGATVWDPDKVVVITDHYVPAVDAQSAAILDLTRRWVREVGIARFHDMQGICHVVLAEYGHVRPGLFAVGGDSHSPTAGAFGCFMVGIGATEMAGVMATGEIWVRVPATLLIRWSGRLAPAVSAKDMMLRLCSAIPMTRTNYRVAEYAGEAVAALSMPERMVLTNMAAELGAKTGIVAPDQTTVAALEAAGADAGDALDWLGDDNAVYEEVFDFDAGALAPLVAAPHDPANVDGADAFAKVRIDQAYIGACTGAKLSDLHMAARVLKGRRVAPGVRLLVAPASQKTTQAAAADGTLAALTEAGSILMPTGCGACAGLGAGILAEREVCITSTSRNFQGRMGAASAEVYLGSPYTVAASAVAGHIEDPRSMVAEAA